MSRPAEFAEQRVAVGKPNTADFPGTRDVPSGEHVIRLALCSPDDGRDLGDTPETVNNGLVFLDEIARIF
jgi:hypothetical protein